MRIQFWRCGQRAAHQPTRVVLGHGERPRPEHLRLLSNPDTHQPAEAAAVLVRGGVTAPSAAVTAAVCAAPQLVPPTRRLDLRLRHRQHTEHRGRRHADARVPGAVRPARRGLRCLCHHPHAGEPLVAAVPLRRRERLHPRGPLLLPPTLDHNASRLQRRCARLLRQDCAKAIASASAASPPAALSRAAIVVAAAAAIRRAVGRGSPRRDRGGRAAEWRRPRGCGHRGGRAAQRGAE